MYISLIMLIGEMSTALKANAMGSSNSPQKVHYIGLSEIKTIIA